MGGLSGDRKRVPEVKFWLQSPASGRQAAGRRGEFFALERVGKLTT